MSIVTPRREEQQVTDTDKNDDRAAAFVTIPDERPTTVDALDEREKQVRDRYAEIRAEAGTAPTAEQVAEMEGLAFAGGKVAQHSILSHDARIEKCDQRWIFQQEVGRPQLRDDQVGDFGSCHDGLSKGLTVLCRHVLLCERHGRLAST